jgi:hypothetical protein
MDSTDVKVAAARAGDHPALETAARVGYAVNGVLHILIGIIAIQLAWFRGGNDASQSGALSRLADNPLGVVVLWVGVLGWLGLALWQISEAVTRGDAGARLKAVVKAVVYLALSWTAFSFATGGGQNSQKQTTDFTATLMSKPFGVWLVGLVGLVVIGVGVYHVYKGWERKFLQDLESHPGSWIVKAGRFGYVAKGIALAIVGGLFLLAAVRHNPNEARGLDGALHNLLGAPGGPFILTLVALGFIAFGVYSFGRARHAKV